MKLRNKKTGEIGYFCFANWNDPVLIIMDKDGVQLAKYNSLAEMNEDWEDVAEEPKEHYFITEYGGVFSLNEYEGLNNVANPEDYKAIGNYFETEEEAEKAVRKLEAWKRLKDKGFKFDKVSGCWIEFTLKSADSDEDYEQGQNDLHLLFGGEE